MAEKARIEPVDESSIDNTREVASELRKQKKAKIMIPSTEHDREPVSVGVNGYVFLIQRDKEVEVPESVVQVLRDAKLTTYRQKKREDGEGNESIPIVSQRWAFQILQ